MKADNVSDWKPSKRAFLRARRLQKHRLFNNLFFDEYFRNSKPNWSKKIHKLIISSIYNAFDFFNKIIWTQEMNNLLKFHKKNTQKGVRRENVNFTLMTIEIVQKKIRNVLKSTNRNIKFHYTKKKDKKLFSNFSNHNCMYFKLNCNNKQTNAIDSISIPLSTVILDCRSMIREYFKS